MLQKLVGPDTFGPVALGEFGGAGGLGFGSEWGRVEGSPLPAAAFS